MVGGGGKSFAVKASCFTHYLSYLNPKGEDSSCKMDGFMAKYFYIKIQMVWQA